MSTQTSLNASEVRAMLDSGAEHSTVIKQLIETGAWSESGAAEIVSFMTHGPDRGLEEFRHVLGRARRSRLMRPSPSAAVCVTGDLGTCTSMLNETPLPPSPKPPIPGPQPLPPPDPKPPEEPDPVPPPTI